MTSWRTWRHPGDAQQILWLTASNGILVTLVVLLIGVSAWAVFRRPQQVTVVIRRETVRAPDGSLVASSEHLESINGRNYQVGEPLTVSVGADRPGFAERRYAASQWVSRYCTISQAIVDRSPDGKVRTARNLELLALVKWCAPGADVRFTQYLINERVVESEVQERWEATWKETLVVPDPDDDYLFRITGEQSIVKIVNASPVQEKRQLQYTIRLIDDPAGRRPENMMTGVQIVGFSYQVLR